MTTAEYLGTPETVLPRELAYGELRVADSPTVPHQRAVRELVLALTPHLRERGLGELLFAPMDVVLDVERALVVQPDVLVISPPRAHLVADKVYGPPDLVIEVLSPHPRIGRLEERLEWFARYGVRECWLASTVEQQVAVLSLDSSGVTNRTLYRGSSPIRSAVIARTEITPLEIFGW